MICLNVGIYLKTFSNRTHDIPCPSTALRGGILFLAEYLFLSNYFLYLIKQIIMDNIGHQVHDSHQGSQDSYQTEVTHRGYAITDPLLLDLLESELEAGWSVDIDVEGGTIIYIDPFGEETCI